MAKVDHKPTQNERILDYIRNFGSITQFEALRDLGVMRLASRISDLKKRGYPIISTSETVKNRFGEKCHVKRYRMGGVSDFQLGKGILIFQDGKTIDVQKGGSK